MTKALLSKLVDLLKKKVKMGNLEPSITPYFNQWFMMPKKFEIFRFIQVIEFANKVTIKNIGSKLVVDKVAEAFEGHAIYFNGDLFLDYD